MAIITDVIAGILSPLAAIFGKAADASVEKFKVDGKVDTALVQAHADLGVARINLLKDKWLIALQFLLALPVVVFFWKCILWDKVLGWGITEPLRGDIKDWSTMIMIFLFGVNALDTWKRKT